MLALTKLQNNVFKYNSKLFEEQNIGRRGRTMVKPQYMAKSAVSGKKYHR